MEVKHLETSCPFFGPGAGVFLYVFCSPGAKVDIQEGINLIDLIVNGLCH